MEPLPKVMSVNWRERTTIDPAILVGRPVVRGTRLAVEFVLDLIAAGWAFDEIVPASPSRTSGPASPTPRTSSPGSASSRRRTAEDALSRQ